MRGRSPVMAKQNREWTIRLLLNRIERSQLSVSAYCSRHDVPFTMRQYHRYRRGWQERGGQALRDSRAQGNQRHVNAEAEGFLNIFYASPLTKNEPPVLSRNEPG